MGRIPEADLGGLGLGPAHSPRHLHAFLSIFSHAVSLADFRLQDRWLAVGDAGDLHPQRHPPGTVLRLVLSSSVEGAGWFIAGFSPGVGRVSAQDTLGPPDQV